MRRFLVLFTLMTSIIARADLLERVRLEDALRERLEQAVHVTDKNARVLARFEFKTFHNDLPGTSALDSDDFTPNQLESTDITHLEIEIYTELASLPKDIEENLYKIVPVPRGKVRITTRHIEAAQVPVLKPVEAKDLSQIAHESIESINSIAKILFGSLGLFLLLVVVGSFLYSSRKMKEFKEQFNLLAKAISEGSGGQQQNRAPLAAAASTSSSASGANNGLSRLPLNAITELLADCYWCEEDTYAHWLWKTLSPEQRSETLNTLPFMKDYSLYFVQGPTLELGYHDHPYYLRPSSCAHLSMAAVNKSLKEDLGLWKQLSPIRQSHTNINLESKLKAMQSTSKTAPDWSKIPATASRILKTKAAWGDISLTDESLLYSNPTLVPVAMKENIRSLVWLAHKDRGVIEKILSKYDARSLASAWIGSEEILKKLEEGLPEKKLKLLQTYRERSPATRLSEVYQELVEEGLKDEAA
jgi:hypothetical protein